MPLGKALIVLYNMGFEYTQNFLTGFYVVLFGPFKNGQEAQCKGMRSQDGCFSEIGGPRARW